MRRTARRAGVFVTTALILFAVVISVATLDDESIDGGIPAVTHVVDAVPGPPAPLQSEECAAGATFVAVGVGAVVSPSRRRRRQPSGRCRRLDSS